MRCAMMLYWKKSELRCGLAEESALAADAVTIGRHDGTPESYRDVAFARNADSVPHK